MSYYCEMCGRELDRKEAKKAVVEGSILILCPSCYSRLSKQHVVREAPPSLARRTPTKTTNKQRGGVKSPVRRVEEYEVVEDYAIRVKAARERQGWPQEVLAQKAGESVNTIKRIEAGKLKPSIELAQRLERLLGIKLLEPVVEEPGVSSSKHKEEFLTIGDILSTEESKKKQHKGGN
ncbi:MAG: multiprotein bridging factor aMBF1 [Desulfurococcaceae archaeon]